MQRQNRECSQMITWCHPDLVERAHHAPSAPSRLRRGYSSTVLHSHPLFDWIRPPRGREGARLAAVHPLLTGVRRHWHWQAQLSTYEWIKPACKAVSSLLKTCQTWAPQRVVTTGLSLYAPSQYYVLRDAACCYRWNRVVCLSVGLSLCHDRKYCKNGLGTSVDYRALTAK